MRIKAVIDTNILVSALLSSNAEAATVKAFKMLFKGNLVPIISDEIILEYNDVLHREKFSFPEESISSLLEEIIRKAIRIIPCHADITLPDEKDKQFFDAMLSDDEAVLITGNMKHFPEHERIMTARKFIDSYGQ